MPQAMEWSFATPMIRPRLPLIRPAFIDYPRSAHGEIFCWSRSGLPALLASCLRGVALQDQRGVGSAETEGIGEGAIERHVVHALAHDRHVGKGRIELVDIRGFGGEAVVYHEKAVDCLLHAGRTEGMAGQRLRRRDRR